MKIAIIGAGLAGTHLYSLLKKEKHTVTIFEKSRGAGGRCSTRYINNFKLDHGTPFFKTNDKQFEKFCEVKVDKNILNKKKNTYYPTNGINKLCSSSLESDDFIKNTKIVSCKYENNLWNLKDQNRVKYENFEKLIITIPASQVLELELNIEQKTKEQLSKVTYDSIATLMIYSNTKEQIDESKLMESGIFKKIINNSSKYDYDDFSSYILHLQPTLTNEQKFGNKEQVERFILEKAYQISGVNLKENFNTVPHFWKYGFVSSFLEVPYIYDKKNSLGFCGDYFMGEDLQSAFKSSQKLFEEKLQYAINLTIKNKIG